VKSSREAGYAVLLAIFLVATMLLLAAAAAPNILTQGRRLREQEAIWRGNQYVRAIRLYYQKNGKYPASLEDLSKANAVGVHFLRKVYNEPMSADGKWRLIYVTPAGQLIGSVHFHSLQEMAVSAAFAGQMAGGAAGFASQVFGQPDPGLAGGAQPPATGQQSGAQPGQQNASPSGQQSGAPQPGLSGQNSPGSLLSSAQPAPLEAVDSPVFGGSVIGVASKVKQSSITVYQGGKTYFEWEFIWNPLLNASGGAAGQQVVVPGLTGPAQPGAAPNPAAFPGGANGSPNSPATLPGTLPGTMPIAPQPVPAPQN
jgi:type II secretory pathway pseudopilin PulG